MWFQFKTDILQLVLEVQQYGKKFLCKGKSVTLALKNLKTRSKAKF